VIEDVVCFFFFVRFSVIWNENHWGDPDVDGRIILRWIFRKWEEVVGDWMERAQDRDRWRAR
jgi:hypothetical protein